MEKARGEGVELDPAEAKRLRLAAVQRRWPTPWNSGRARALAAAPTAGAGSRRVSAPAAMVPTSARRTDAHDRPGMAGLLLRVHIVGEQDRNRDHGRDRRSLFPTPPIPGYHPQNCPPRR